MNKQSSKMAQSKFRTSSFRKWGWPLIGTGVVVGVVGTIMFAGQAGSYRADQDLMILGICLTALGVAAGNVGFFLLMFGILEDRIYEAQGISRNGAAWIHETLENRQPPIKTNDI